jgi:hypothetical protein
VIVILNEVKNLMISTESIIEILRLSPQNDITTQPPRGEGWGGGGLSNCSRGLNFFKGSIYNLNGLINLPLLNS